MKYPLRWYHWAVREFACYFAGGDSSAQRLRNYCVDEHVLIAMRQTQLCYSSIMFVE
jgi:hypothetical protein